MFIRDSIILNGFALTNVKTGTDKHYKTCLDLFFRQIFEGPDEELLP
jgi:hypothetical protein